MRKTALLVTIIFTLSLVPAVADNAPEPPAADAPGAAEGLIPPWAKDLRRTEIITLGSLPFVTIWTTLAYSLAVYGQLTNPIDKSSSNFTEGDQWRIIGISLGACMALGVADLAISLAGRRSRELRERNVHREIKVVPLVPEAERDRSCLELEGVESAVF